MNNSIHGTTDSAVLCSSAAGSERYMTSVDLKRYLTARRRIHEKTLTEAEQSQGVKRTEEKQSPCAAQQSLIGQPVVNKAHNLSHQSSAHIDHAVILKGRNGAQKSIATRADDRAGGLACRLEAKLEKSKLSKHIIKVAEEWIAVDNKEYRREGEYKKIPFPLMIMILTIGFSLLLIVSGTVITSKASMELDIKNNQFAQMSEYKDELEQELRLKNDLRYIEKVARTKLGMIDKDYAAVKLIGVEPEEKVVLYDTDKSSGGIGLSALLNALGFPN